MIRIIFSGVDVLELSRNWCLESLCNLKSEAETINQFKVIRKSAQFHTRYSCGCLHEAAMDWSMHACGHLRFQLRLLIGFLHQFRVQKCTYLFGVFTSRCDARASAACKMAGALKNCSYHRPENESQSEL